MVIDNNTGEPAVIILNELNKHYAQGVEIVQGVSDVSMQVQQKDFVVITGRSGSGKTTLLSLIGGLTDPTSGSVEIFGKRLNQLDDAAISSLRSERIGFVFQFACLIPTLTAFDNVRLPGLFAKDPVTVERAEELLAMVGLSDKIDNYPFELSGGQEARVGLVRALANQPDLLMADEPTGNLDVETEREILELLRDLNQQLGTTVVLVTHNPKLAAYGNRHLIMDDGKVEEALAQKPMEVTLAE